MLHPPVPADLLLPLIFPLLRHQNWCHWEASAREGSLCKGWWSCASTVSLSLASAGPLGPYSQPGFVVVPADEYVAPWNTPQAAAWYLWESGFCPALLSGSPNRGQRTGVTPILSDFVRFAPILSDFRWGFAEPGKQSADFVQFRADFVRFGVFANQTKSDKISVPFVPSPFGNSRYFSTWMILSPCLQFS